VFCSFLAMMSPLIYCVAWLFLCHSVATWNSKCFDPTLPPTVGEYELNGTRVPCGFKNRPDSFPGTLLKGTKPGCSFIL